MAKARKTFSFFFFFSLFEGNIQTNEMLSSTHYKLFR
jgi:hypothetical protein